MQHITRARGAAAAATAGGAALRFAPSVVFRRGAALSQQQRRISSGAVSGATEVAVEATERQRRESVLADARAFLETELRAMFSASTPPGAEITRARYSADVRFQDPVTNIQGIDAYALLVRALKAAFRPDFELRSVEAAAPDKVEARWTMTANVPLLPWSPVVPITGTSVYTVDLATGHVTSHVDEWDAVESNAFPSLEAAFLLARRALDVTQVPRGLETPAYSVLRARRDYEVREYAAFTVAEAPVSRGAGVASGGGFNELARYIFGGNQGEEKMEMTTPVFTEPAADGSRMAFVMEEGKFADPSTLPAPLDAGITARRVAPRLVAVARFPGIALDWDVAREERALRSALLRDGLVPKAGFTCARYNDPLTLPPFRRNEVLIEIEAADAKKEGGAGSSAVML